MSDLHKSAGGGTFRHLPLDARHVVALLGGRTLDPCGGTARYELPSATAACLLAEWFAGRGQHAGTPVRLGDQPECLLLVDSEDAGTYDDGAGA